MKVLTKRVIISLLILFSFLTVPSISHADWEFGWNDTDISIPDTINTAAFKHHSGKNKIKKITLYTVGSMEYSIALMMLTLKNLR